uniref:Uncharacterized protein n=1 Tax=Tetranychus urticae TaxID=32264 RepID=T1KP37_TETUR
MELCSLGNKALEKKHGLKVVTMAGRLLNTDQQLEIFEAS